MEETQKILVTEESNKERLDVFLSTKLNISRNQIQKLIDQNLITINQEKPKKAGQQIKTGNTIEISSALDVAKKIKNAKNENKKMIDTVKSIFKKTTKTKVEIIAKEKDYLVVNKQAGLLVHPTQADESVALSKILVSKFKEIKNVGDPIQMPYGNTLYKKNMENPRPGIVHRLDKSASGLLVVARTQKMFEYLKKQFKDRTITKEYLVLVYGKIKIDHDIIDFPIARKKDGKMSALPKTTKGVSNDKGKEAKTEFWVEKRFINHTLLKVKLHTGRMHQIRAHFLAYNHPVVGDTLYYQKQYKKWTGKLDRLFLHCYKLGFTDLNNKYQEFTIATPKELTEYLKKIS